MDNHQSKRCMHTHKHKQNAKQNGETNLPPPHRNKTVTMDGLIKKTRLAGGWREHTESGRKKE